MLAADITLWTDDVWASHSRFFWGLRLHLVCTLGGLPVAYALTGAKADERQTLLLRQARTGETPRPGAHLFKPLRQTIESINHTLKGELDLERHGGRTRPESSSASCNASSP